MAYRPTEARSRNMAAIRGKDTGPEMHVRRSVHAAGFRFRLHRRSLPGRPDLVFPGFRLAVFVHGCFWHGHDCLRGRRPRTNTDYWIPKLEGNRQRDERNVSALEEAGWEVFTIWECGLSAETERLLCRLKYLRTNNERSQA
ncbi:MAG: very short patch repair endonuclease [Chloroflexota bacterium]|nr:very short patch repair endonuclease [Chloroflexota bacterium]